MLGWSVLLPELSAHMSPMPMIFHMSSTPNTVHLHLCAPCFSTLKLQTLQVASAAHDDSERYSNLPPKLQEKLMGFQREGIKFALKRGGRLLVGDEMGLGKTVQAIGIMACYRDEWPCVIITPSSLRGLEQPLNTGLTTCILAGTRTG